MRLIVACLVALIAASSLSPSAQDQPEYKIRNMPAAALIFPALQTHMPTRHGDVAPLHPVEGMPSNAQTKMNVDPAQLQREAHELLDLSQSLQDDIESVNQGLHPKDMIEKLKRIQKLAKHLRGEIEP
jgi:hypothetical protein